MLGMPGAVMGGNELARDDGAGEAGLGPVEVELGAVVGERLLAGDAGADDRLAGGDGDGDLRGEAVGEEAGHGDGEPAAGVEQDADRVGDLREA